MIKLSNIIQHLHSHKIVMSCECCIESSIPVQPSQVQRLQRDAVCYGACYSRVRDAKLWLDGFDIGTSWKFRAFVGLHPISIRQDCTYMTGWWWMIQMTHFSKGWHLGFVAPVDLL